MKALVPTIAPSEQNKLAAALNGEADATEALVDFAAQNGDHVILLQLIELFDKFKVNTIFIVIK